MCHDTLLRYGLQISVAQNITSSPAVTNTSENRYKSHSYIIHVLDNSNFKAIFNSFCDLRTKST